MGLRGRIFSLCLVTAPLWAQPSQPPPFTCVANAGTPVIVRVEGITELVGDLLLQCTGGTPTPAGQTVPLATFKLSFNANVTSRVLGTNGSSEALLLIDEPGAPSNQTTPQIPCITPLIGCPGVAPVKFGGNTPNVYQGVITSSNSTMFNGIPIDPPSTTGIRVYRVTNLRVNANQAYVDQVALNPSAPVTITAGITITTADGTPIPVTNPTVTLAIAKPSMGFGVAATTLTQFGGNPVTGLSGGAANCNMNVTELFVNAFKERTTSANATNPNAAGVQNVPGQNSPITESGFVPGGAGATAFTNPFGYVPGLTQSGTIWQTTLEGFSGTLSAQLPYSILMTDANGNFAGYTIVYPFGGTVSGNNISFPHAPDGSVTFFAGVASLMNTSTVKTVNFPITLTGSATTIPANIQAVTTYANSQFPQNTLFIPTSPFYNPYPIFGPFSNGITPPPAVPYQAGCSIVDPNNDLPTLNFLGMPSPAFTQLSGPVAPAVYNVGIVSPTQQPLTVALAKDPSATWLNAQLNTTHTPATLFLSVNPTTTPNKYSTTLQISSPQESGATFPLTVNFNDTPGPWFTRYGFVNSASYVPQAVAPGMPFLIGGGEFAPAQEANLTLNANGFVSTSIGNTQVLFDGQPVPLIYSVNIAGTGYVAGMAPFELDGKTQTSVQLVYNGVASPPVPFFVLDTVPALLTADTSGGGEGAILNHDFSVNGPANGELPGNEVFIYGGGGGQTTPAGRTGGVTGVGAPVAAFKLPVTVFIDGAQATDVPYAGPAPALVEGYFQINVRIPANARRGASLPVVIQIGDKITQPGVTVYVK
jgi:uncharacterized protein (TIGR03437 family)